MSDTILEAAKRSPLLPQLVRELTEAVDAEEQARAKFLEELTTEMKAEFILGQVCMHSPAKAKHLVATGNFFAALHHFCRKSSNGCVFAEKCLISLTRNDFEPDVVWFSNAKAAKFEANQMRFPAPDFVVEVLSESTEERDRGIKLEDYALHGVSEYWIVDADKQCVEQYLLEGNQYDLHEKLSHGTVCSQVIDGFEIAIDMLFAE